MIVIVFGNLHQDKADAQEDNMHSALSEKAKNVSFQLP